MDKDRISAAAEKGLQSLMDTAARLWPRDDLQLFEASMNMYVAQEFRALGFDAFLEWPLGRKHRIDFLAYNKSEGVLVLGETKRTWTDRPQIPDLIRDCKRLVERWRDLSRWRFGADTLPAAERQDPFEPRKIFGVAILGANEDLQALRARHRGEVAELEGITGGLQGTKHPVEQYFLHFAVWDIPVLSDATTTIPR